MTIQPSVQYESLAQAADRVGISVWTLRRRTAAGELAAYTAGRRIVRVRPEDVDGLFAPIPTRRG